MATKAAGLIVWTWDIPRDEVWLSEKDRALFGLPPSEKLTAKRIRSVIHPDDRELVQQLVEKSLNTDEELEGEYRIVLGDGRVRWATRRGRVEFDGDGNPICERGVLMDITEVVKNKEALREFEERVVLAAKAAHLGVWELDIDSNEVWMSDSALRLFQFDSAARPKHAEIQERVHPDDRARRAVAVQKAIETKGEYEIENRILLPDGTLRWIYGRGRCIQRQGQRARLIGVSMDITEVVKNKEALRESEERMSLAIEAANLGLWEWNVGKNELWSTKARLARFGLPYMNGLEVQTRLQHVSPSTRVIVLTAKDDPSVRRTVMNAGAFAFFIKGVESGEFLAGVKAAAVSRN